MPTTKVPSYRLHKRSQQAVVTLAGHDFYLGKYGTAESREEYARLVGEWLRLKGKPAPPQLRSAIRPKSITVADAAERYLEWSNSHQAPAERAHVKGMLKIVLKLYLHENAENIGPVALREIRNLMLAKGWSRNYVNEQIGRVRRWYKWLSAEELIKSEVYFALKVVNGLRRGEDGARETSRILPVSEDTVTATLAKLSDIVGDMVRLQLLTGMRPAELCMLRPCDLDRNGAEWKYTPRRHKTEHHDKDRTIAIGPRGQEILTRYLFRDAEACCFQPRTRNGVSSQQYDVASYRRAIHRACDRAFPCPELRKVKNSEMSPAQKEELREWRSAHRWSPNQLRHAFATKVRKEFGLEASQVALGHSRADVTQIYAERDLAKAAEVARRIG